MKMRVRKKKNKHIILKLIMVIIIGIICAFLLTRYFSKNIKPVFMVYAEDEIRGIIILVINNSINEEIANDFTDEKLFNVEKNVNGEIQLISYNAKNVNMILSDITKKTQNNLNLLEQGDANYIDTNSDSFVEYDSNLLKNGIICEIPFGAFSKNSLISNIGPKIPVKFNVLGEVSSNVKTSVKEYGINSAFLEVAIEVSVTARFYLPFVSDKIVISSAIPISMKIIQGNIPNFYSGGFNSSFGYIYSYDDV